MPKLAGLSLKEAGRRRCRAEVLDMVVKSGKVEYRLIRRCFTEEKQFCQWMTNLQRAAWSGQGFPSVPLPKTTSMSKEKYHTPIGAFQSTFVLYSIGFTIFVTTTKSK